MNPRIVASRLAAAVLTRPAATTPVAANPQQQPSADHGATKLHKGALFRPVPGRPQARPTGPRQLARGPLQANDLPMGSDPDDASDEMAAPSVRVRPPMAFAASFSSDTEGRGHDTAEGGSATAGVGTARISASQEPPSTIALKAFAQRLIATIDSAASEGSRVHGLTHELQAMLSSSGLKPMGVGELAQVRAALLESAAQRGPATSDAARRLNAMLPLMLLQMMRPRTDEQQPLAKARLGLSALRRLP